MGILDKINNIASENGLDLQSVVDKTQSKISGVSQQFVGKVQSKPEPNERVEAPFEQPSSKPAFCSNCGTKLNDGAKFCHGCGASVGVTQAPIPPIPQSNAPERKQEYAGTVMKCPNCGSVINETTAICPDCGLRLTGKSAVSSVQEFKDELMKLENKRMSGIKGMILGSSTMVDPVDKKKIALIQNFPIPNSVDDITEFMLLAISNIDVSLSKGKWNRRAPINETSYTIKRSISNAWITKMEQAYKKAEMLFPNEKAFEYLKKIYFEKCSELKIKVK